MFTLLKEKEARQGKGKVLILYLLVQELNKIKKTTIDFASPEAYAKYIPVNIEKWNVSTSNP